MITCLCLKDFGEFDNTEKRREQLTSLADQEFTITVDKYPDGQGKENTGYISTHLDTKF